MVLVENKDGNSQAPREDHVLKNGLGPYLLVAHSPHGQRCSREFHLHLTIFEPRQDQLLLNHPVASNSIRKLTFYQNYELQIWFVVRKD